MKAPWLMTALAAAFFMAAPAWAFHGQCIERPKLMGWLLDKYGERPWGRGISDRRDGVHELTVSSVGSYSFIISLGNGLSCIIASGEEWIPRPDGNSPPPGEDASHD